jgi:hypothetical protein
MSKRGLSLKTTKLDNGESIIYHPESGCVFKSKGEKVVVGRYIDGQYFDMDSETLELCTEFKLTPDRSLLVEEEEGGDVDGDVEAVEEEDSPPPAPPKAVKSEGGKKSSNSQPKVEPPKEEEEPLPPLVVVTTQSVTSPTSPHSLSPTSFFKDVCKDDFDLNLEALSMNYKKLKSELMTKESELQSALSEIKAKDTEIKQLKDKFGMMKQFLS